MFVFVWSIALTLGSWPTCLDWLLDCVAVGQVRQRGSRNTCRMPMFPVAVFCNKNQVEVCRVFSYVSLSETPLCTVFGMMMWAVLLVTHVHVAKTGCHALHVLDTGSTTAALHAGLMAPVLQRAAAARAACMAYLPRHEQVVTC